MTEPKMYPPVLTKRDFVERYLRGEFGNRSPSWDTVAEYLASGYRGRVHLRNKRRAGTTFYNNAAEEMVARLRQLGSDSVNYYLSAMAPMHGTILQGEVMQGPKGLDLYCTRERLPMREALATNAVRYVGLQAVGTLRSYLPARDYAWLDVLLCRYPHHVVEFTTLDREWGTVPGYRTLYWEVRDY